MKKLLVTSLAVLGFCSRPALAVFPIYQSVLISTNTTYAHSMQVGTINISSANIAAINSTGPVTLSGTSSLSGTVGLGSAGNAVTVSSNVVLGGAIILGGSAGTSGQVPTSNGPGAAQSYTTPATLATIIATSSTWTANQTFSSATITTLNVSTMTPSGGIVGATNGTTAPTGDYGEVLSSSTVDAFVSLTNTQYKDVATLSITSGTWLLIGECQYGGSGTTSDNVRCGISTTSGNSSTGLTLGTTEFGWQPITGTVRGGGLSVYPIAISSNTTYFLKVRVDFSAGTVTAFGKLSALRIH